MGAIEHRTALAISGILTRNFIGAKIYHIGDKILTRVPIIRPIYSSAKQLLTAIAEPSLSSFKEVALIEYPRKGVYALCFISNRIETEINGEMKKMVAVFVPSTPTPVSGMAIIVPEKDIILLNMSVEEGIKFLVSGGDASPTILTNSVSLNSNSKQEVFGETS